MQSKRLLTPSSLIWPPEVENAIRKSVRGQMLDIGTGNGVKLQRVLQFCGAQVGGVVAIEPSSSLVLQAESNLGPFGVSVKGCSLFDLATDEQFDRILMFEVIEHMSDGAARASLDLVARLLHKGGVFNCSTPNKWPYYLCERLLGRTQRMRRMSMPCHISLFAV